MCDLFQFQHQTIEKLKNKLSDNNLVMLMGEKESGKTVLIRKFCKENSNYFITFFSSEPQYKFCDFNCLSPELKKEFHDKLQRNEYGKSILKDIASTVSNIAFLSTENLLESLLSADEKNEIDEFISFMSKKKYNKEQLYVFDGLDYFDKKSLLFLHKILYAVLYHKLKNVKILVVIDTTIEGRNKIIDSYYLTKMEQVNICCPTDTDLSTLVDPAIYSLARHIPITYLLKLGDKCQNIEFYYSDKLDNLSKENTYIKKIILPLSLFDEQMSFANLTILLSDLTNYELSQGLDILTANSLIDRLEIDKNIFYKVPDLLRNSIRKSIPDYIALHRYEIFVRELENIAPFNYVLKYKLYKKIENYDNSYANSILAYCSIARGDIYGTNEELLELSDFLGNSPYADFFMALENSYKLYNHNEYRECYNNINAFLNEKGIWKDKIFILSIYIPEFVLELIFLREMCAGRIIDYDTGIIKEELLLVDSAINNCAKLIGNNELLLRLQEKSLLLETYISDQSNQKQRILFNKYFEICDLYRAHIRKSNTFTIKQWEIRYASFLLKINIISNVPDKIRILEEGYHILRRNKDRYYKKYLRAACNYACDLMWRNKYKQSYQILDEAVEFIQSNNLERYWGILLQMHIFADLYMNSPVNAQSLLDKYDKLVWNQDYIRSRMHEPFICASNYSILLTAAGHTRKACVLLRKSLQQCRVQSQSVYCRYLLQTNLAAIEYLCGDSQKAYLLEQSCKQLVEQKLVPIFSYPFLQKRCNLMMEIYQKAKPVENVIMPLSVRQTLSTGYCSDNYVRLLLFSDINYWTD